ncbi:ABC transporter substrate-binding protein [Motiliproteus sp. MSK22-1]|uniref:substrate-binding periplasmic protein n=1 Tax=Motiliproteus sp. MSK22-1 TaxID=1897630 RepID=UPI0009776B70|nr:transporter substrate-binding domain-containing protein [Motiliproteus sp. MSK22-1]OMH33791.1 hypothetical protein BGP75_12435 [Motiliproteus sp. MSK22-1]
MISRSRLCELICRWVWLIVIIRIGPVNGAEVVTDSVYTLYTQSLPPYSMMVQESSADSKSADSKFSVSAGSLSQNKRTGNSASAEQTARSLTRASGLAVDIVEQLFSRSGLSSRVEILPWSRAYRMAANDRQGCLFPVQRTQEREAQFQWISPLIITETGFFTRADFPASIRTLDDVRDLRIASYRGNAIADYLTGFGYDVDISNDEFVNLKRLQIKRVDVWAADTLTAAFFIRKSSGTDVHNQLTFFTTLRGLACNTAIPVEVIKELRLQLKTMYADGTIELIRDKYR